ncbi:GDSL-like Lipase/Acylhydrolase [Posidoniimonas polymericola]|uniref:GDSL-like Lipase/Acylhydrolase n=2 Tax=Posidoniimonas polymericola TaxID=2528002 RepID=A0A5C5ZDT1_9BACT|nr:GDSL-like Lipase/Acylhydrolase [Posidoniimonas polymericola]
MLMTCCLHAATVLAQPAQGTKPQTDRWAAAMEEFALQDERSPYPEGGVVLTGSSSARLWGVEQAFPELDPPILNRGFGGSTYRDLVRHAELLVLKHRPRLVILYSGDNDIAGGRSIESIQGEFEELTDRIRAELPEATIAVIPAKPSPSRWELVDKYHALNAEIKNVCGQHEGMVYVDIWPAMLGDDGRPRPELFRDDNLHMTPAGYTIWNDAVRELVQAEQE